MKHHEVYYLAIMSLDVAQWSELLYLKTNFESSYLSVDNF